MEVTIKDTEVLAVLTFELQITSVEARELMHTTIYEPNSGIIVDLFNKIKELSQQELNNIVVTDNNVRK